MPLALYGSIGLNPQRILYGEKYRPLESGVFDYLKVEKLSPWSHRVAIANHWWIKKHTALAWEDARGIEQAVFIPGQLTWRQALLIAREEFTHSIPSAIIFRVNNHKRAYLYD